MLINNFFSSFVVAVASKANTCSGHIIVDVNRRPIPEGHLASHVTQTTNHGSKNCPWLVRASQGQRLTLSLIELVTSSESPFPAYNLDGNKMADKSYVVIHPTESSDMVCPIDGFLRFLNCYRLLRCKSSSNPSQEK